MPFIRSPACLFTTTAGLLLAAGWWTPSAAQQGDGVVLPGRAVSDSFSAADRVGTDGPFRHAYTYAGTSGEIVRLGPDPDSVEPLELRLHLESVESDWSGGPQGFLGAVTAALPRIGRYRIIVEADRPVRYAFTLRSDVPRAEDTPERGWVRHAVLSSGELHLYQPDSVRETSDGLFEVWELTVYPKEQSFVQAPFTQAKRLWRLDCDRRRIALVTAVLYNGDAVVTSFTPDVREFDPVVPGTSGESLEDSVCVR